MLFPYLADYEPESEAFESKKKDIIRYCDLKYHSHEFFNFVTNFDFFDSYVTSSKNDRRNVLDLMKVVLYYVTQASKLDVACLQLKGEPRGRIEEENKRWNSHFSELQQLMTKTDGQVKNACRIRQNIQIFRIFGETMWADLTEILQLSFVTI